MKKWWMVVLVFTLALSLTSCGKKKAALTTQDSILTYCDNADKTSQMDVYVTRSKSQQGLYEVRIAPVTVREPGDVMRVDIANNTLGSRVMVQEVVLNPGQVIYAGNLTQSDIATYNILAITPYQPGLTFLQGSNTTGKEIYCEFLVPN